VAGVAALSATIPKLPVVAAFHSCVPALLNAETCGSFPPPYVAPEPNPPAIGVVKERYMLLALSMSRPPGNKVGDTDVLSTTRVVAPPLTIHTLALCCVK
jgi:hypothetical protein